MNLMGAKSWLSAGMVGLVLAAAASAGLFVDVPRDHWAYAAIERVAAAGAMKGDGDRFHGDRLLSRYEAAVLVQRLLQAAQGPAGEGMAPSDVQDLERLGHEFAEELALLGTRVATAEEGLASLRSDFDKLKAGSGNKPVPQGLASAFTGLVSVGLIATDDGAPTPPAPAAAGGSLTRYTAATPNQTFFTIPQASIQLNQTVAPGVKIHVQYDYGTDGLNGGGTVGLNAAYVIVDKLFGKIGARIGGMNGILASWEITGPHRTFNHAITLSAVNTFLYRGRIMGVEFSPMTNVKPSDLRWRLAVYSSPDFALPPGAGRVGVGAMNDALFTAPLAGSKTFDDTMGWYFDLESPADPKRNWGWRASIFDRGGDVSAGPGGPAPSQEVSGQHMGLWWKKDDFKLVFQHLWAENEFANLAVGGESEIRAWYLMALYQMTKDTSLTLRYDDWKNEINTAVASGLEGDAFTVAVNHKTSATSLVQFEWLTPTERLIAPVANSDFRDDLVQLRYKVWF